MYEAIATVLEKITPTCLRMGGSKLIILTFNYTTRGLL